MSNIDIIAIIDVGGSLGAIKSSDDGSVGDDEPAVMPSSPAARTASSQQQRATSAPHTARQ